MGWPSPVPLSTPMEEVPLVIIQASIVAYFCLSVLCDFFSEEEIVLGTASLFLPYDGAESHESLVLLARLLILGSLPIVII